MSKKRFNVGKTKIVKAPWEEDRYIYDVNSGSSPLFSSDVYVFIIQVIVGIAVFLWVYNR
jgi:hypothetical protein